MQKSTTHFEQIPVELVKKIAKVDVLDDNDENYGRVATISTMQLSKETKTDEDIRYAEWQAPYQQALLELDQKKMRERIDAAETAISDRLRAIAGSSNHHHAERQAIDDALSSLRVLKRNVTA